MVKYFTELENRDNQYLDLIKVNKYKNANINIKSLPLEFYQKYQELFLILTDLDVLYQRCLDNNISQVFLNEEIYDGYDFEWFYSSYINDEDIIDYLTIKGKNRLDFLVQIFNQNYQNSDYLYKYLSAIFDLFLINDYELQYWDKYTVYRYLKSTMIVAKYQNKLVKNTEKIINQALNEINNKKIEIPLEPFKPVKFKLPNSWYITPYNHLYNSMGTNGHKEANLRYPFYYTILRDNENINPDSYLKEIKQIEQNGFITSNEYEEYLNLIYDFPCVYPDFYYDLDSIPKTIYRMMAKRSYNPKLVNLIIGIESAQAGLHNFFYQLRQYSNDYKRDITLLKKLSFDDILVRCCGFHKITSLPDKIITTSLINYEEEFREYIEKGWIIDFIPPFIINKSKGEIELYPSEFLTIRKILKK